jgi:hypothetical protein
MTDEPIDWSQIYYEHPSRDMPDHLWKRWMRDGHPPMGRRQSEAERVRDMVAPLLELVTREVLVAVDEKLAELRKEFRGLARKARLRRWDRKDIQRFVDSKPRAPE